MRARPRRTDLSVQLLQYVDESPQSGGHIQVCADTPAGEVRRAIFEGSSTYPAIKTALEGRLAELEAHKATTLSMDFDD